MYVKGENMIKKFLKYSGLSIIGLGLITGCKNESQTGDSSKETTMATIMNTDLHTLDPAKCTEQPTHSYYINQVYEGLVKYDENSNLAPALAENWTISDDGKVFTFFLRKNIKFHNGNTLNAEKFKKSLERACNVKIMSPEADKFLGNVLGAKDCLSGKTNTIKGIEAIDDNTLKITLAEYDPVFLHKLIYTTGVVTDVDAIGGVDTIINDVKQVIGTGPFMLKEYTPNSRFVLESFKDYWDEEKPALDSIRVTIMKDASTQIASYQSHSINFLKAPTTQMAGLLKDEDLNKNIHQFNTSAIFYLTLNPEKFAPFKDIRVRKAFAMAINKTKIGDMLKDSFITTANSLIPAGFPGYRADAFQYPYDPEAAKELLKEANYTSETFPKINLSCSDSPLAGKICENISLQLKENLGINIKVTALDFNAFNQKKREDGFGLFFSGWSADYMDPATFLYDLFCSKSPLNNHGYKDAKYDAVVTNAQNTPYTELSKRFELFAESEDILLKSGSILPIYYPTDAWLIQDTVEGLKMNTMSLQPLNTLKYKNNTVFNNN